MTFFNQNTIFIVIIGAVLGIIAYRYFAGPPKEEDESEKRLRRKAVSTMRLMGWSYNPDGDYFYMEGDEEGTLLTYRDAIGKILKGIKTKLQQPPPPVQQNPPVENRFQQQQRFQKTPPHPMQQQQRIYVEDPPEYHSQPHQEPPSQPEPIPFRSPFGKSSSAKSKEEFLSQKPIKQVSPKNIQQ